MALRGDALRNLARSMFSSFYSQGVSANEALRTLRGMGLGYRRQDFLRDYREGLGKFNQESTIKFVRNDAIPSDSAFLPKYHGLPDKYGYLVRYTQFDTDRGEYVSGYAWYFTDYKGTKRQIADRIIDYFVGRGKYNATEIEITIEAGHINPYWEEF
jgi:hypothetical protein